MTLIILIGSGAGEVQDTGMADQAPIARLGECIFLASAPQPLAHSQNGNDFLGLAIGTLIWEVLIIKYFKYQEPQMG